MRNTLPLRSTGLAGVLALTVVTVPVASAESSLSSSFSSSGTPATKTENKPWVHVEPPKKTASQPLRMPDGTTIQIMDDVLGNYSAHTGFRSGDLGMMAPIDNDGEFAMIFGDSFRGAFGQGWMSPVGVVAKMDEDGFIKILRPIDNTSEVSDMISYRRVNDKTLIPSDVINIGGVLYMHGTWHVPFGTVVSSEVWESTDQGKTWTSVGVAPGDYLDGMTQLLTWDKGPDGFIYIMSTKFGRKSPVFMFRARPEDIAHPGNWQGFSSEGWGKKAEAILDESVQAGELNLRYIDGHWVLAMFNEKTLAVEVRISDKLETSWEDVPVATIAKNGPWENAQNPLNWSQPYGGYIVPGSHLDNMDIVISQWNTSNNSRYNATQFNVKGLDKFYGIDAEAAREDVVVDVRETAPDSTPAMQAENSLVQNQPELFSLSWDNTSTVRTVAIVLGVLAGVGLLGVAALPLYWDMLPPQIQALLPR